MWIFKIHLWNVLVCIVYVRPWSPRTNQWHPFDLPKFVQNTNATYWKPSYAYNRNPEKKRVQNHTKKVLIQLFSTYAAVESTPIGSFAFERFTTLLTTSGTSNQMNGSSWIRIRFVRWSIINLEKCPKGQHILVGKMFSLNNTVYLAFQVLVSLDWTDLIIVDGPQTFIRMLMSPNLNVNAILVEQVLQSKEMCKWQTNSYQCLTMRAVIIVFIATIHWTMAKCYDPWS